MNLTLIGCRVIQRELYKLCADSRHNVEIRWMKAALHEQPGALRPALQAAIDEIERDDDTLPDAILLGYGLCSMGVVGLHTEKVPLVVPRAHDCISLILGSQKRYRALFEQYEGSVYWYSSGWIEQFKVPGKRFDKQAKYMEYVMKYGEDNAQYLIEMEKGWTEHYNYAAMIRWQDIDDGLFANMARELSEKDGLRYVEVSGEDVLLRKLVDGEWDDDFAVIEPGEELVYQSDERILGAKKRERFFQKLKDDPIKGQSPAANV